MSTVTKDRATETGAERVIPQQPVERVDEPTAAAPPAKRRLADLPASIWWAAGSLVLMVVGAFGPWASVLGITINGTDDSKDGWLVLGAAVLAALLLLGYVVRRRAWYAVVATLAGVASAATAAYDIADTNNIASQTGNGLISTEWGIYLSLAASISLALSTLAVLLQARRNKGR